MSILNEPFNNPEGVKLQIDTMLAEYQVLRQAIEKFRDMQGQLDNLALTVVGLSIPLTLAVLERSPESVGVILLVPIVLFLISFSQLRHERQIAIDASYIDINLRPKLNQLLSTISGHSVSILEYEAFATMRNPVSKNRLLETIAVASRSAISISCGVGLIVLFLYVKFFFTDSKWYFYEILLLLINFAVITVVFLLSSLILGFYAQIRAVHKH